MKDFVAALAKSQEHATEPLENLTNVKFPEFDQIMQKYAMIACNLDPIEVFTPINGEKERIRFLRGVEKGRRYDPRFQYDTQLLDHAMKQQKPLEKLRLQLERLDVASLSPNKRALRALGLARLNETVLTCEIAKSIKAGYNGRTKKLLEATPNSRSF